MASDEQWYVLIEANSSEEWELQKKHHVEGDRSAALARAEEICRTWNPKYWEPEKCGRTIFQISEKAGWWK
ncbi:hypothetical protein ACFZCU_39120 [Streptomyces canus]|uniref:hypothetical protein n=1 Tax=Streptomyces canus TaxID=58343 RepID=UPI0036E9E8CE